MYYKAIPFLWDTFTYFNYFSIRDSFRCVTVFFCIYTRCTTRRYLSCNTLLHILIIFLSEIPIVYSVFFKTEGFSCYTHEYLAKAKSIPSLRMHDLLEILQYVFSHLDGFPSIHKTKCCITICAMLLFSMYTFHCN